MKPELARRIDRATWGIVKPEYDPYFFTPTAEEIIRFMGEGWEVPSLHNKADGLAVEYYDQNLRTGVLRLYIKPEHVSVHVELYQLEAMKADSKNLTARNDIGLWRPDKVTLHENQFYPESGYLHVQSKYGSITVNRALMVHANGALSTSIGDIIIDTSIDVGNILTAYKWRK